MQPLSSLQGLTEWAKGTDRMPVIFFGHGSPMNAIEENEFVAGFRNIGKTIQKPKAVLCISAHWESQFAPFQGRPPTIRELL